MEEEAEARQGLSRAGRKEMVDEIKVKCEIWENADREGFLRLIEHLEMLF